MGVSVLEARGLVVGRAGRPVVSGVDLVIGTGERLALVGANGSGKTTLLRALAGLDRPLAGEILWSGGTLPAGAARVRQVGVLFQDEAPPVFTVRQLVTLGLGLDRPPSARDWPSVEAILARLGLDEVAATPCLRLSGGEWQRAALARALVAGPALLLLDEPTSHLDPARRGDLADLLDGLRGVVAVVLATHDLDVAAACDRVAVLGAGRVTALDRPGHALTPAILAEALGVGVRRIEDPLGGPPFFRVVGVSAASFEAGARKRTAHLAGGLR